MKNQDAQLKIEYIDAIKKITIKYNDEFSI